MVHRRRHGAGSGEGAADESAADAAALVASVQMQLRWLSMLWRWCL